MSRTVTRSAIAVLLGEVRRNSTSLELINQQPPDPPRRAAKRGKDSRPRY